MKNSSINGSVAGVIFILMTFSFVLPIFSEQRAVVLSRGAKHWCKIAREKSCLKGAMNIVLFSDDRRYQISI